MSKSIADQAHEPTSQVPDLPAKLFPTPVRPAVFRSLWAVTIALLAGLGIIAWLYLAAVGQ